MDDESNSCEGYDHDDVIDDGIHDDRDQIHDSDEDSNDVS